MYALHALFVALILYWAIFPPFPNEKKSDLALGLVFGLALGNHLTTLLLLPVLLASTLSLPGKTMAVGSPLAVPPINGAGCGIAGLSQPAPARPRTSARQLGESRHAEEFCLAGLCAAVSG